MKTILTVSFILFILCSCVREEDNIPATGGDCSDGKFSLSFVNDDFATTRAFGNSMATAAEKKVNTAKLFIFRSGNKVFEKYLTVTETGNIGTATPLIFTVPGMLASTAYSYYMVINKGNLAATSLSDLQSVTENDIASYNGAWAAVNDAAAAANRSGGFVIEGDSTLTTGSDLSVTQNIAINARRITAKMDITTNIDQTVFGAGNKYTGTLSIDSAIISKTQPTTPLIKATPTTTTGAFTLARQIPNTLTANTTYQNRFYLFENGAIAANNRVLLTLYATYTNGSAISHIVYSTEVTGTGGSIVRNGAYTVTVNIIGLTGTSLSVTVTLKDWESIVTQTANLGS